MAMCCGDRSLQESRGQAESKSQPNSRPLRLNPDNPHTKADSARARRRLLAQELVQPVETRRDGRPQGRPVEGGDVQGRVGRHRAGVADGRNPVLVVGLRELESALKVPRPDGQDQLCRRADVRPKPSLAGRPEPRPQVKALRKTPTRVRREAIPCWVFPSAPQGQICYYSAPCGASRDLHWRQLKASMSSPEGWVSSLDRLQRCGANVGVRSPYTLPEGPV